MVGTPTDEWLERLGSADPTPGGGGAAAMTVAMGAALVEMVANLTMGKKAYAEHEEHVRATGKQAAELRARGLALVDADETAFDAVMAAYRLPKQTDQERAERTARIEAATAAAARPPLQVAEVAARVIVLASTLPGRSNRNVLSDVGVAASLAVAALESAAVNVSVNLGGLREKSTRDQLRTELEGHLAALRTGRETVDNVRASLEK
jgi:methenyltetrahydrofolate cyclohydrolase